MTRIPSPSGPARVAGLILLPFLLLATLPSPAPAAPPPATACVASVPISPPFAASWWGRFYGYLEHTLTSRARMIQLGVLGMIIALIIMIKK